MHNADQVVLGTTLSSSRVVTAHASNPADTPAGFAVCLDDDSTLSLDQADGKLIGVSLGKSLSDTTKTAVVRKGLQVPLRCMNQFAHGLISITSYANLVDDTDDTIKIGATTFTAQTGAATPEDATFQAASSNNATAISLAAQINAHPVASLVVAATVVNSTYVYVRALSAGDAGETIDFVYDDVDGTGDSVGAVMTPSSGDLAGGGNDFTVAAGAVVYVNDETGEACASDHENAYATNAVYCEGSTRAALDEYGAVVLGEEDLPVEVALIDMLGGL